MCHYSGQQTPVKSELVNSTKEKVLCLCVTQCKSLGFESNLQEKCLLRNIPRNAKNILINKGIVTDPIKEG